MSNKVKVKKSQLDYFRRLARKIPLEIEAYLIGKVVSPTLVVVDQFVYPKNYKIQTIDNVLWNDEEYGALATKTQERGLSIVGSIHSHINCLPLLSETDHKACVTGQLRIIGVCSVINNKTKVCFWTADSSLTCDLVYAESKSDTSET